MNVPIILILSGRYWPHPNDRLYLCPDCAKAEVHKQRSGYRVNHSKAKHADCAFCGRKLARSEQAPLPWEDYPKHGDRAQLWGGIGSCGEIRRTLAAPPADHSERTD